MTIAGSENDLKENLTIRNKVLTNNSMKNANKKRSIGNCTRKERHRNHTRWETLKT